MTCTDYNAIILPTTVDLYSSLYSEVFFSEIRQSAPMIDTLFMEVRVLCVGGSGCCVSIFGD